MRVGVWCIFYDLSDRMCVKCIYKISIIKRSTIFTH